MASTPPLRAGALRACQAEPSQRAIEAAAWLPARVNTPPAKSASGAAARSASTRPSSEAADTSVPVPRWSQPPGPVAYAGATDQARQSPSTAIHRAGLAVWVTVGLPVVARRGLL